MDVLDALEHKTRLFDANELIAILGYKNRKAVYKLVKRKKNPLPHSRLNGRLRFNGSQVAEWLRRNSIGAIYQPSVMVNRMAECKF